MLSMMDLKHKCIMNRIINKLRRLIIVLLDYENLQMKHTKRKTPRGFVDIYTYGRQTYI